MVSNQSFVSGDSVVAEAELPAGLSAGGSISKSNLGDFSSEFSSEAVGSAKRYVTEAIRHGFDLGVGPGPLNHFWNIGAAD